MTFVIFILKLISFGSAWCISGTSCTGSSLKCFYSFFDILFLIILDLPKMILNYKSCIMCVFYNKNEINHQVTIEEIEGDSDASTESEEDESDKDDDIDSDDSEEMLMMLLEDDFQEQK